MIVLFYEMFSWHIAPQKLTLLHALILPSPFPSLPLPLRTLLRLRQHFLRLSGSPPLQILPTLVIRFATFRGRDQAVEAGSRRDKQLAVGIAQATVGQIAAVIWLAIRTPGQAVVFLGPLAQVVQRGATVCGKGTAR